MSGKGKILKTKKGKIVKLIDDKTVKVEVEQKKAHPLYGKIMKSFKRYLADKNNFEVKVNSEVVIQECNPISKRKCFQVIEIIEKNK